MMNFATSGNYYATHCSYSVFMLFISGNTYSFLRSPTCQDINLLLM